MTGIAAERAVQNDLAIAIFDAMPEGWTRVVRHYVQIGTVSRGAGVLSMGDEVRAAPPVTPREYEAWDELRQVMSDSEAGAWFAASIRVDVTGDYHLDFQWNDRPEWPETVSEAGVVSVSSTIDPAEFKIDFRRYPRSVHFRPSWWDELLLRASVQFEDRPLPSELAALTDSHNWSVLRQRIRAVIDEEATESAPAPPSTSTVTEQFLQDLIDHTTVGTIRRVAQDTGLPCGKFSGELGDLAGVSSREFVENDSDFRSVVESLRVTVEAVVKHEIDSVISWPRPERLESGGGR